MWQRLLQKIYAHPYLFNLVVAALIALGVYLASIDVDEADRSGRTALHIAAEQGDLAEINSLLARGATVDAREHCRWTPMMRAAQNGHLDSVKRLLAAGADIDARDKDGYNALTASIISNRPRVFEYLLQQGIQVNLQDHSVGWTALIWAVKLQRGAMIEALLEQGADSTLRDHDGLNAADWARKSGDVELAKRLDGRS